MGRSEEDWFLDGSEMFPWSDKDEHARLVAARADVIAGTFSAESLTSTHRRDFPISLSAPILWYHITSSIMVGKEHARTRLVVITDH
jgi:hypothetical protein